MDELRVALRDFLDLTTNPLLLAPAGRSSGPSGSRRIPAFRRRIDRVDELIHREIAERRRGRATSPSATTSSRCWSPPATRTAAR